MERVDLIRELERFTPECEQEEADKAEMLRLLRSEDGEELVTRQFPAHLSASAWVLNPERSHVLMAFHNIYGAWSWLGGHLDGEWNASGVAVREVNEESGLHARF